MSTAVPWLRRGLIRLYDTIFLDVLPALLGWWSLRWYQAVYGVTVGRGVRVWGRVVLAKSAQGTMVIGAGVRIGSHVQRTGVALYSRCKLRTYTTGVIVLGERVALSGTSITCRSTAVTIGSDTIVGPNVIMTDSDFHAVRSRDRLRDLGYAADRPVAIGAGVWIGMNSLILKGVTIGDGAVIGAGSVVCRDIPAGALAVGNPCRVRRARA